MSDEKVCDFNHLILYAKQWYEKRDVMSDVKRILGVRCALDHVSDADMWHLCVSALVKYAPPDRIRYYLDDLFRPRGEEIGAPFFADSCSLVRAVKNVLAVLANLVVFEDGKCVLNLGEPDPTILPLSEQVMKRAEARGA